MSAILTYHPREPIPVVPSPTDPERLLTIHEVAQIVRVDQTTVRRWIKHGYLAAVRLPGMGHRANYRVKRRMLDVLINGLDWREERKDVT